MNAYGFSVFPRRGNRRTLALLALGCMAQGAIYAQTAQAAAGASAARPAVAAAAVPASSVNPMTGQTLSAETLQQQLNSAKLITQLRQEELKQAQALFEVELSRLRAQAEQLRLRSETQQALARPTSMPAPTIGSARPVQAGRSSVNAAAPAAAALPQNWAARPTPGGTIPPGASMAVGEEIVASSVPVPPVMPVAAVPTGGGSISVGAQTVRFSGVSQAVSVASVTYVDQQQPLGRALTGAGSSLPRQTQASAGQIIPQMPPSAPGFSYSSPPALQR